MIKWIGQHIVDFVARFRSDVYLEGITTSTETDMLVVDSANKVSKRAIDAITVDVSDFMTNGVDNRIVTATGADGLNAESQLTYDGSTNILTVSSLTNNRPAIYVTSQNADSGGPVFNFVNNLTGEDDDDLGVFKWSGDNAADEDTLFAQILAEIETAADTDEAGKLSLTVACSDGSTSALQQALIATGHGTSNIVDIGLGYGAASTTTIAGTLTMGSTAAMTNAGALSVAAQPNITTMTGFLGGTANALVTDDGDGTVTSESTLTYDSETLTIGADDNGAAKIVRKTHGDDNGGILQVAGGDATGTDKGGGMVYITGGLGTGTGGGGVVRIATANADSSGSSANSFAHSWNFTNEGEFHTASVGFGITEYVDFNSTDFEDHLAAGDHAAGKRLLYSPGANDSLTDGQIYFLHTDGTWNQADASAVATGASQLLGVGNGNARSAGVVLDGFVRIPSTEILNTPGSGAVDGLPVYVSTTAGHFDFTAPSGNNEFVRVAGYAIDDDSNDVLVYFNPDRTWVKITA